VHNLVFKNTDRNLIHCVLETVQFITWDLRSSETLGSVEWQFFTDVLGQLNGSIFKKLVYQYRWSMHEWIKQCYYIRVSLPPLYGISETGKERKDP
jgi:hypothetical protein